MGLKSSLQRLLADDDTPRYRCDLCDLSFTENHPNCPACGSPDVEARF